MTRCNPRRLEALVLALGSSSLSVAGEQQQEKRKRAAHRAPQREIREQNVFVARERLKCFLKSVFPWELHQVETVAVFTNNKHCHTEA